MKILINQNDAAFLRNIMQALLYTTPFPREIRRKIERLQDKLSASRGYFGDFPYSGKRRDVELLTRMTGRTIKSLETELVKLQEPPATPEEGTEEAKKEKEARINQLNLHLEYAKSVQAKLSDTLADHDEAPEYVSTAEHKVEATSNAAN